MAGSLVVSRRVKLAEQPPGSLVVCASKHKVRLVLLHLGQSIIVYCPNYSGLDTTFD